MVVVPAGWFVMGSDDGPRSSRPAHRVFLEAFAIGRTEVTNAQMQAFVQATGEEPQSWQEGTGPGSDEEPARGILWREAQAYCAWLGMRLPTEAEWEKAARGTDGRTYPWGDTWEASRANIAEAGRAGPVDVGSFLEGASPYAALDMIGNVQEWVADYYDPGYYAVAPARAPT
jgi:sulfatase modifying factor 1